MSDEYGPHSRYNRYEDEPDAVLTPDSTNGRRLSRDSAAQELAAEDEAYERAGHYTTPERQRGRAVPPRARKLVQIVVNDVVLGEVDADELTAGAQFDLEDCASAHDLIRWLVQYAGGNEKEAIAALRPMKAQALIDLIVEASTAIGQAISVPKRNARR